MELYLLIITLFISFIICCLYKYHNKRNKKFILKDKTKHLNIDMYGDDKCSFTVNMKHKLVQMNLFEYINYIDVSTTHGINKYEKLKVSGVPVFHSKLTDKIQLGDMSVDELLDKLS